MMYDLEWLVSDYGSFLARFGLEEAAVRDHYVLWRSKSGSESAKDYLWYLFQVILGETSKQIQIERDLQKNKIEIYQAMWFFCTHVEGQKANDLVRLITEARLRLWQLELPYQFQVKMLSGHCCPHCDQYNGRLFSPEEILQNHYVGSEECTSDSGCSCSLVPVAERDQNGQMLLRDTGAN